MRTSFRTFCLFWIFLITVGARPTDLELKEAFENLKEANSVEVVHRSYFVILSAEEKAFPMLLEQKDRMEIAKRAVFQESRLDKDLKTGEIIGWHAPRMGEVALMLIEIQVLDKVPVSYWRYCTFNRSNIGEWLSKHDGKILKELRSIAAAESLKQAETAQKTASDEFNEGAITFFKGRVAEIQAEKIRGPGPKE